jgi:RNA polymerase sigma factor (sigma-70 family)
MDRSPVSPPVLAGIEQEIASLYEQEAGGLLRYSISIAGNREMAHDALQEAFFRFFLCRSGGQEIRLPKSWLFRVARNYILDQKKVGSRNEIGVESLLNLPCPALRTDASRIPELLDGLLDIGLSPRELECVRLRTEDLRYEEIASVLGLQSGTVGALLARAHGKIRKAVGERAAKNRTSPAVTPEKGYAS